MRLGLFSITRPDFCHLGQHFFLAAMMGGALSLAGCGKQGVPGVPVAQVNGKVITEYHLETELQQAISAEGNGTRSGALQALIDRQLLQDEALRRRLDRDPYVSSAIESAKAQILAQAYLRSQLAYVAAPTREEMQAYFNRNPEKFAQRKVFHLKQITLASADLTGELKAAMDQARSIEDMAAWLDGRRIAYALGRQIRSSADVPAAMLEKMRDLQAGQLLAMREGNEAYLLAITSVEESPVSFEVALPQIERNLLEERGRQRGDAELARLQASAKVAFQNTKNSGLIASKYVDELQATARMASTTPQIRQRNTQ